MMMIPEPTANFVLVFTSGLQQLLRCKSLSYRRERAAVTLVTELCDVRHFRFLGRFGGGDCVAERGADFCQSVRVVEGWNFNSLPLGDEFWAEAGGFEQIGQAGCDGSEQRDLARFVGVCDSLD